MIPFTQSREISPAFFDALDSLTHSPSMLADFAEAVIDERFKSGTWLPALHSELLRLYRWALLRLTGSELNLDNQNFETPSNVATLLPAYGIAVHCVRRAVPFAALGFGVECSFSRLSPLAEGTVRRVAQTLGVENMQVSRTTSREVVAHFASKRLPVVLTGRLETLRTLRNDHPALLLFGATGRCSTILARTNSDAEEFRAKLIKSQLEPSCTRLSNTIILLENLGLEIARPSETVACDIPQLAEVLADLHPSIVYVMPGIFTLVPQFICGYKTIAVDANGELEDHFQGFGADPVGGWPGDYFI